MKQYTTPKTRTLTICIENSFTASASHTCNNVCSLWHICRDRQEGMYCYDKKYN